MYKQILLLIGGLCFMVSCTGEFTPDPVDPRLPKYSQEGNNTAGALVNGQPWQAVKSCAFMGCQEDLYVLYYENSAGMIDSVSLSLYGSFTAEGPGAIMEFKLKDVGGTTEDLPVLEGVYELDAAHHKGYYNGCLAQKGRLEIRYDGRGDRHSEENANVIAGTFSLYVEEGECGVVAVEWGRFDYHF